MLLTALKTFFFLLPIANDTTTLLTLQCVELQNVLKNEQIKNDLIMKKEIQQLNKNATTLLQSKLDTMASKLEEQHVQDMEQVKQAYETQYEQKYNNSVNLLKKTFSEKHDLLISQKNEKYEMDLLKYQKQAQINSTKYIEAVDALQVKYDAAALKLKQVQHENEAIKLNNVKQLQTLEQEWVSIQSEGASIA